MEKTRKTVKAGSFPGSRVSSMGFSRYASLPSGSRLLLTSPEPWIPGKVRPFCKMRPSHRVEMYQRTSREGEWGGLWDRSPPSQEPNFSPDPLLSSVFSVCFRLRSSNFAATGSGKNISFMGSVVYWEFSFPPPCTVVSVVKNNAFIATTVPALSLALSPGRSV